MVVTATGGTPPYTGVGAFDEYAGTYAYTVTDAYGCSASAIATIIARPKPYLGLDLSDSICAGQSFDLTAVAYNGLHPQIWDAAIPDSVTAPGFYNGIYTSPNGCLDTVMQEIFVKPLPLVPVWNSGLQNVCVPRDSVLYYVYPDSAVYYVWTYTGFGGKLVADSSNTAYIDYGDFATDGKIQVIAVAKNGCGHSAPAIFDIHILHPPVITLLSNDADNTICLGKDVTYTATGGHDYQWYVNGSLVQGEVGSVYQFRPDNDTLYTVVAVAINICGRDTAPTELLDVLETPVVDAGVDTSIGLGNWVMLHGSVKGISPFVYNWTPAVTLSDPTIPNPIATPRDSTLYTLTVSNQYGCVASDDVFVGVYVDGVYNFPNLITPNGDGANDKWIIDLKEFPDGNLIIFNRWGEVVYENSAYDNTWDGTYKGKALDDGTYYFVMKVPSLNNKIYKSAINIIRTK